jgi:2,3-bisphosphoglycerate-dependent phosphoglycerate mutase
MYQIVLIRHGQSSWNKQNIFTGWTDVGLSEQGEEEARQGGEKLLQKGFKFDLAYTSVLKRAIDTLQIILNTINQTDLEVIKDWRLNERHYGALQGLNKAETAQKHGDEQVHIWRRSFDVRPPLLDADDERYPGNQAEYQDIETDLIPLGESLEDTVNRVLPCWQEDIIPRIKAGKQIIISAHGNSLRALLMQAESIPRDKISELEIPTGVPLVCKLDEHMKIIQKDYL